MNLFIANSAYFDHQVSDGLAAHLFVGVAYDPDSFVGDLCTGKAFTELSDEIPAHPEVPFLFCNDWKILKKYDSNYRPTEFWVRHLKSFCCAGMDYNETDLALRTLSALSSDNPEKLYQPTRGLDQLICLNHWSFECAIRNHCSDGLERNAYRSAYIKNYLDHMMVYTREIE